MKYAPVLITTLHRAEHFKKCVESLKKCVDANDTDLFIALDCPASAEYEEGYLKIRDYLRTGDFSAFGSFHVIKREKPHGYWRNLAALRRTVLEKYDIFITLQDDIEVSPCFLLYMNAALERYEQDWDVIAVSGYSYPVKWSCSEGAVAIRQNYIASEWGIGFWKKKYEEMEKMFAGRYLQHRFCSAYRAGKFRHMTDACIMDYAAACLDLCDKDSLLCRVCDVSLRIYLATDDKYAIIPVLSKTRNRGFDGSGLYCGRICATGSKEESYADCYGYDSQPMDEKRSFKLVMDRAGEHKKNRSALNDFDRRDEKEMRLLRRRIRRYVWAGPGVYRICRAAWALPFREKHFLCRWAMKNGRT